MPGRTLTEAEFEKVKAEVLASAPPNLDEATFNKWIGPTFVAAIAEAETRPAGLEGSALSRLASNAWAQVNPLTIVGGLAQAALSPVETVKNIAGASMAEGAKARAAFGQGNYLEAAGHASGMLPLIGPAAVAAGEQIGQGDIAGGVGTGLGLVAGTLAPGAVAKLPARLQKIPIVPSLARAAADPVGEAVAWGLRQGIKVDPATATGNQFLRGTQAMAERSAVGSVVGKSAREAQAASLEATGRRLAEQAAPGVPATPETAGTAVRDELVKTGQARGREARAAYREVEAAEANLLHADYVPDDLSPAVKTRMREELGGELPSPAEIQELRRIREELDAVPFQKGKLSKTFESGQAEDVYSHRAAGAPVYHEILQEAPGTSQMTRGDVQRSIEVALRTGRLSNAARGALAVAKKRLSEAGWQYEGLSSPILPPDAGLTSSVMKLPVDLRPAKVGLQPLYEQLQQQQKNTGILLGQKGQMLNALHTLMTAGDHAPLTVVDRALSDLKALARADIPELKTAGEGAAGKVVQELDAQVRAAAAKAGPEVLAALTRGRQATRAKYVARDLVKRLGKTEEGRGVYNKATQANDANRRLLANLQRHAPEAMPQVGRAFLEELLHKATAEGGFQRVAALQADWQRLGPETKKLLFRDAQHIKDLDNFFLLAKKMGENPNPSGSAFTALQGGELGLWWMNPASGAMASATGGILAALLNSPRTTQLLLNGLRLPVGAKVARAAWASSLERAMREAGPALVPAAAEEPGAEQPVRVRIP